MSNIYSNIKDLRLVNNMSQGQLAKAMDMNIAKIQNIENGRQRVDHEFLAKLSAIFTIDLNVLILGNLNTTDPLISQPIVSEETFIPIKRLSIEASAGAGTIVHDEVGTGSYAFNRKWLERRNLKPDHLAIISIRGDSMEPELRNGDLVLINRSEKSLVDGNIYVVQFSAGLFVKRIQHLPGGVVHLISQNKAYNTIEIKHPEADGVEVIGRVVASMHEW